MTNQERYAWISLVSTLAILGLYIVLAIGLPEPIEDHADAISDFFVKAFGFALLVRIGLAVYGAFEKRRVEKDERDALIELKGYRSAYFFVITVVVTLAGHLLISDFVSDAAGARVFLSAPFVTLHVLVITFLVAGVFEATTKLFLYRKDGLS